MAFKKKTFIDGATVIDAKFLNDIQDAILDYRKPFLQSYQIDILRTILEAVLYKDDNGGEHWQGVIDSFLDSLKSPVIRYEEDAPNGEGVLVLVYTPHEIDESGVLILE